mgnify:CR=1 FL=1
MNRMLVTLALVALAGVAHAQKVYKCQVDGQSVYQSIPCEKDQDTVATRNVVKDPNLTYTERSRNARMLYDARARMQADAGRGQPPMRGSVIDGASDPEKCEDLRWRRELAETFGRDSSEQLKRDTEKACGP